MDSCMRAYSTVQQFFCHGGYCELILSLARTSCRLLFTARPTAHPLAGGRQIYMYLYRVCLQGNSRRKNIYNTRMNKHIHTYTPTHLHTYLHTYIHTYIHTYKHTKSYKPYKSYNTTLQILQTLPYPTLPYLQTLHYTTPTNITHM